MTPELLAPAGSPEALDAAIGEGADAVYLGLRSFNARMRSANFAYSQFEGSLRSLHRMGRKLYVTVNTVFEQREADRLYQLLKYLAALGPDGILVQDFGIITMVRENFPSLKLHASTQMNIACARGVNLLSRYGFSRAVLARELSLEEIREIRGSTNMELEVFVHGALCMSVSGLCLFSSYLGGKSANRGMCTQACRRFYRQENEGGYYFSPADLELIEKIPALADAGVNSFKIEGRMKSAEYAGTVVAAYRRVLDSLDSGEEARSRAVKEARDMLRGDFARAKTSFLIDGFSLTWLNPEQNGGTGIPLGRLLRVKGGEGDRAGLIAGGPVLPVPGDSIRLHKADDSGRVSHKLSVAEPDKGGASGESSGSRPYWIDIPEGFEPGDQVYLIQTKSMTRRYPQVIPRNLAAFKRLPGRDKAPLPDLPEVKKSLSQTSGGTGKSGKGKGGSKPAFPEGLYAQVSRLEDLYILQSSRPAGVMVNYHHQLLSRLLGSQKQPLPFSPEDIILVLDPFFPQSLEAELVEDVSVLAEKGYRRFVVNNPGHFSLFRDSGVVLAAGPWLYVFNQWAYAFTVSNGADYFVSPLENNRQNLERTIPQEGSRGFRRSQVFITLYSRPSLFRIRADLGGIYNFHRFSDARDGDFRLSTGPQGSLVYPEEPFYIADKIPFLKEAGFSRFILDFSAGSLKKGEYRDLMEAVRNALPLKGSGRFNWKDGFYKTEETGEKRAAP
ncbi:MAG: U32 family peptidase [Treponema sp.]|jgi:putative protease|nr:U32 family peptidase [Treponema sp.]